MRTVVLVLAAISIAVWTLLAWAVYALLGYAEGMAAASVPYLPLPPDLVIWSAALLSGTGGVLVWIVWGIGALMIGGLTLVALAFFPRHSADGPSTAPRAYDAGPGTYGAASAYGARQNADARPAAPDEGPREIGIAQAGSVEEIIARASGRPPRRP